MSVAHMPGAPAMRWHDVEAVPVGGARAPSLRQVVDSVAQSIGAWVLVERCGDVLSHATGPTPCPAPLVEAILRRSTSGLSHPAAGRGRAGAQSGLRAVDARDGIRVWTTGPAPSNADIEQICVACAHDSPAVTNRVVAQLLQPRGLQSVGAEPPAQLVALPGGPSVSPLSREAQALLGDRGRVHVEGNWLYLALAPTEPAQPIVEALSQRHHSQLTAGIADVPTGATDWVATARLARRLAAMAAATGRTCASARTPRVLARLMLDAARDATAAYLNELGISPLERLTAYDERAGGALTTTLAAWLGGGCDVAAAAQALQTHPNTVRYRIRRASEITGFDLDDADVQAALRLVLP